MDDVERNQMWTDQHKCGLSGEREISRLLKKHQLNVDVARRGIKLMVFGMVAHEKVHLKFMEFLVSNLFMI